MISARQACENYGKDANGNNVFWEFTDLVKAYETIDRHDMWKILYKGVWSWRKVAESSSENLCRYSWV